MKKILASIGIGSATVDTVLPSTTVTPGETIDAEINISGGNAEQDISAIDLEIETRYETEEGYAEGTIDRLRLSDGFTIRPGQDEIRTTSIEIPYNTPVTIDRVDVWIETELEIDLALDPEDKDYLDVRPTPRMQALFDAAEDLGFSLRKSACQADPYGRYTTGRPFVQEFEFRPQSGPFAGRVDEIELVCDAGSDALAVTVEVDRRGGLLSEMTDMDERKTQITIRSTDRNQIANQLSEILERFS
ncbi:sporulation protein [Halocatena marina]|uniref:sporulation protein n=1 Tax=Halocatena marina TaxID=2934937 RepID=UPI00200D802F|nr:sporulation protein [Halocatena marina]